MEVEDTPFDMNKMFTASQSKSQIWTLLVSVGLQKYMDNITKAGIDFHAFCNLTRDDMRGIGIGNYADQECLLEVVRPMATMYRELYYSTVNWNQVINNVKESSDMLAGSLCDMNGTLKKYPILEHSLADYDTPSFRAALLLLDLIESRLDFMDRDLKEILRKKAQGAASKTDTKRKNSRNKMAAFGLLALAAVSAIWHFRKPQQLPA